MAEREDSEQTASGSERPAAQRLAHFELLDEIGRGGMGVVYRARDTRLGRQVAIKLLPAAFSSDGDRRSRLLREARAAAQLNHPNIATLYEVGEAEWTPPAGEDELGGDGPRQVIFLAMEYVEGQDLGPRLEGDGLSLKETLDFGIQISEALAAAHSAGVIHRDLKPQNLRITGDGRIKILDFGLAKLVQEGSVVDEPMLTAHGAIVGTAPYMAPEQLQGASEVDSRCDLFSFGVVLYQMLTGRLPFHAARLVDYVKALTHQTPEPPSHSNPEVSPQLEQVVERLLAKEPRDRYPSAVEAGQDLKSLARGQPIEPPPSRTRPGDSIFGEVLQPFRRPWVGWLVGAVFLVALLGVWWSSSRPASDGPVASDPVKMVYMPLFENVSGDAEKDPICRGLGFALANSFQEVPVLVVQDEKKAEDLGVRMQLRGSCQRFGAEDAAVLLDLIDLETGILVWSRTIDTEQDRLVGEMTWRVSEALGVALLPQVRERLSRDPGRSVTALTHYFRGLERQNRFDDEEALEEAVEQFRQAIELEPEFALAHVGLSEAMRQLVVQFNREALPEEAEEEARRALELDASLTAARRALARFLIDEGRFEEAIAEMRDLLAVQPNNPDLYLQLAEARFRRGGVEEAVGELDDALSRLPLAASTQWRLWNQVGAYLLELGDYDRALEAFLKAHDLAPESVTVPLENLMAVELHRNRPEEALFWFEQLPAEHQTMRNALNLGNTYFSLGRYEEAAARYSDAIRLAPSEPMGYASRGDALVRLGQPGAAQINYERAAAAIAKQLELSPASLTLRSRKMLYLSKAGSCDLALPLAEELERVSPEAPEFLLRLAQTFALCGPSDRALELLQKTIAAGVPHGRVCQEPELIEVCDELTATG